MKRSIRYGVFETNSSSVHSLTIVSKEEFEKFKRGELIFDKEMDALVVPKVKEEKNPPEEDDDYDEDYDYRYETYDNFGGDEYETFERRHKTKSGDEIVAFGYYGESR